MVSERHMTAEKGKGNLLKFYIVNQELHTRPELHTRSAQYVCDCVVSFTQTKTCPLTPLSSDAFPFPPRRPHLNLLFEIYFEWKLC